MRFDVARWPEGPGGDEVADEEPLEVRVEGVPTAVTMRTPGHDLDLAAGFLWTEGVIDGPDDLQAIAIVAPNTVDALLAEGVPPARARSADRSFYATSSCGVCGKASIDRLRRDHPAVRAWIPDPLVLAGLSDALLAAQPRSAPTGGLHAAALFDAAGGVAHLREDVGRHNAVDKVLGSRLQADDLDLGHLGLVVSSRAGFEIVQKALAARVSVVACLGAPTSLAVETARATGLGLYARVRPGRWTSYC